MDNPSDPKEVLVRIEELKYRLETLDFERTNIQRQLELLTNLLNAPAPIKPAQSELSPDAKLTLFRRLFRGREDVYARRWVSAKTGKAGYSPVCEGGWQAHTQPIAERKYLPLDDAIIRAHLRGDDPDWRGRDFVVGVYPLLLDETCWFVAADFDKAGWQKDARAYADTCALLGISAAVERSRSGNGAHVWVFFEQPVPAVLARKLGTLVLTRAMEMRPDIGLDSYDRLFPNQDTMPSGNFGNLIALPLQGLARKHGNSVFVDAEFNPYPDQIAFLATVELTPLNRLCRIVEEAGKNGQIVGVRMVYTDEDAAEPWNALPTAISKKLTISEPLPEKISVVIGNQIYVDKTNLPPRLINALIRTAAFQNPEFYKAQAMRFPTFGKPRVIACAEDFPGHIGLPRGCQDEISHLFSDLGVAVDWMDERYPGQPIDVQFLGTLRPEQEAVCEKLLEHETGVLAATTAFGKTVIAANLIAARKVNTLILVHRQQLMDQWVERLAEFLSIERKQIGTIGGGKRKPSGIVDVALIQSMHPGGTVDNIIRDYGHLVVDECHHLSAHSFEQVARACRARFITGLSATTTRKDGHHPIIFMQCGPIRYTVDARQQAAERPFNHRVIVRSTRFAEGVELTDTSIQAIYNQLSRDQRRNQQIVDDVCTAHKQGRSALVLTERTEHLDNLLELLQPHIPNLIVMKGGMGRKQRQSIKEQIDAQPEGQPRLILSTGKYVGEGFDDARLDTLFLVMPVSWRGTLAQYAGRLHRLHHNKTEVQVYDYVDSNLPMLTRMFERRVKGYRAIGYQVAPMLNDLTLESDLQLTAPQ